MKRLRILGLALVAVFALGAVAASGASAASFYECAKAPKEGKTYTGKYSDKNCTTTTTGGKYELQPGVGKGKAFKGSSKASALIVVVPPGVNPEFPGGATIKVECATSKDSGKAAAPNKVEKVVAEFAKCKALGSPCASGTKKEVIKTNDLNGEVVDIEEGSGVGSLLKPESGTALANFTCTGLATSNVHGSVIAEQTGDVNTISKEFVDHYKVGPGLGEVEYAPGHKYTPIVNIPTHVSGGVNGEHFLDTEIVKEGKDEGELPSGQEQTATQKGEAIEVKP
jgi:hypothetical protein